MDEKSGLPRAPQARDPHPRAYQPAAGSGISRAAIVVAALLILLLLGGAWYFWQQRFVLPPLTPPPTEPAPVAAAPPPAPSAPPAGIQHPIDEAPPVAAASAPAPLTLDNADPVMRSALVELLGSKAIAMLQTDDFARRVVASVDNLGRSQAASRLWPVTPTPGRFSVQAGDGGDQVAAANAARYDAFVALATSVDPKRAAAMYRRHYALFQRAYQELGYPDRYFNDRLVAVIDQMLATPDPATPPTLRLVEVKGPIAAGADRPWTRYEFTDPALEALPAGSKVLLRMGPAHAQRVKAQLRALRAEIARK
jgi:hypothetical protein